MFNRKFNNCSKLLSIVSLASFSFFSVGNLYADSVGLSANATINRALIVQAGDPISFGTIITSGSAGTVTLHKSDNSLTYSGGVTSASGGISGFVSFVAPEPATYGLTIDATVQLVNTIDNTKNITLSPSVEMLNYVATTYSEPVQVHLGGLLSLPTNTQQGVYSGIVNVDVSII